MNDEFETVFPLPLWFVLLVALLFGWPLNAFSEPKFKASAGNGAVVTLYSDPCQLTGTVTNLPGHATWVHNGKTSKGCWGAASGLVMFYWEDKTVGHASVEAFEALTGV
jgi:hypothetical protein